MVAWSDVCLWDAGVLEEAFYDLRSLTRKVDQALGDAQSAECQVLSEGQGVEAARGALRECNDSCADLVEALRSLARGVDEAAQGVAEVRRRVLACQDYAASRPLVTLCPDGAVTLSPQDGTAAGPGPGGLPGRAALEAAQAAAQAQELAMMVRDTTAYADQVDNDLTNALTNIAAAAPPPPPPSPGRPTTAYFVTIFLLGLGPAFLPLLKYVDIFPKHPLILRGHRRPGRKSFGGPGLGKPVPGEHANMPGVDAWDYQGDSEYEGSGPYAQRPSDPVDHFVHGCALRIAKALTFTLPDASKNLTHYLDNTGTPQDVDVDRMLQDLPDLPVNARNAAEKMAAEAVEAAKTSGATGPVTYPFTTPWEPEHASRSESMNWFLALGGYQACTEGTVTVYPPDPANGRPDWTYKYDYRVHVADRYNWDKGKDTDVGGVTIGDDQMRALHQAGLAQEYDVTGTSSVMSGEG